MMSHGPLSIDACSLTEKVIVPCGGCGGKLLGIKLAGSCGSGSSQPTESTSRNTLESYGENLTDKLSSDKFDKLRITDNHDAVSIPLHTGKLGLVKINDHASCASVGHGAMLWGNGYEKIGSKQPILFTKISTRHFATTKSKYYDPVVLPNPLVEYAVAFHAYYGGDSISYGFLAPTCYQKGWLRVPANTHQE